MSLIKFLGTGGGRTVTMTQLRATGGIYMEIGDAQIYIDPGPGALVYSTREKVPLRNLDALLLSHAHLDHTNDANAIIEAMTNGALRERGTLMGSESSIAGCREGEKEIDRVVSSYHLKAVEQVVVLKPGDRLSIKDVDVVATKTLHTDPMCVGFLFKTERLIIGYTSDTTYFEHIGEQFKGCDILILNCLFSKNPYKSKGVEFSRHMDAEDAINIINSARPKMAVIQHYGMDMLRNNPWKVAKTIAGKTGVRTIAVRDFQEIKFDADTGEKDSSLYGWI